MNLIQDTKMKKTIDKNVQTFTSLDQVIDAISMLEDTLTRIKSYLNSGNFATSISAYPELNFDEILTQISADSEYQTLSEEDKEYLATKVRESVENIEKFVIYKFFNAFVKYYNNSVDKYSQATKSLSLAAKHEKLTEDDYHNINKFNKLFAIDYNTIYSLISIPTINGKQIYIIDKIQKIIEERNVIKIFSNFTFFKKDGTRKNIEKRYVVDYKMINRLLLDKNIYTLDSDFYNKKIRKMFTAIKSEAAKKSEATSSKEKEAAISSDEDENLK